MTDAAANKRARDITDAEDKDAGPAGESPTKKAKSEAVPAKQPATTKSQVQSTTMEKPFVTIALHYDGSQDITSGRLRVNTRFHVGVPVTWFDSGKYLTGTVLGEDGDDLVIFLDRDVQSYHTLPLVWVESRWVAIVRK